MFRIPPRRAWSLFGVIAFFGFAAWLLPLAILVALAGLGDSGIAARTVDGTAWSGQMLDVSFEGARLGDLRVQVTPLDLLRGSARFRISSLAGNGVSGEGFAGLAGQGVHNIDAPLVLGGELRAIGFETAQLSGLSLRFTSGRCTEASGQMTVHLSAGLLARAVGPQMSGAASCNNGHLSFRLSDPDAKGMLLLDVPAQGPQHFSFVLRSIGTLDEGAFKALGFVETPIGYRFAGVIPD